MAFSGKARARQGRTGQAPPPPSSPSSHGNIMSNEWSEIYIVNFLIYCPSYPAGEGGGGVEEVYHTENRQRSFTYHIPYLILKRPCYRRRLPTAERARFQRSSQKKIREEGSYASSSHRTLLYFSYFFPPLSLFILALIFLVGNNPLPLFCF